jgi:signal transduction histidine kinase
LSNEKILEINLKDNGIGMSKAVQDQIFNFNFTTKSTEQGTGLGLNISRRFIRESGGDIILKESRAGEGATFLITIPIV